MQYTDTVPSPPTRWLPTCRGVPDEGSEKFRELDMLEMCHPMAEQTVTVFVPLHAYLPAVNYSRSWNAVSSLIIPVIAQRRQLGSNHPCSSSTRNENNLILTALTCLRFTLPFMVENWRCSLPIIQILRLHNYRATAELSHYMMSGS